AVMTAYNLFNGEWCSQNRDLITGILREELGFNWLVMTDWWAINDSLKAVQSGLDLEMPAPEVFSSIQNHLDKGDISESDIDRMAGNIVKTAVFMDFYNPDFKDKSFLENYSHHESVAYQTASEGIVLLRNKDEILPVSGQTDILITGRFVTETARGGGAAEVEGFNHLSLLEALKEELGETVRYVENPTEDEIAAAGVVFLSTGTIDSEGCDRDFSLPDEEEERVLKTVSLNNKTVVLVSSGGGVRMTDWADRSAAIVYAWYGGQQGNRALAGVLSGKINPSGKLPISIERDFSDSPGAAYLPEGESLYSGWDSDGEKDHAVYSVHYKEDIMVGYRWYETEGIDPLFPFGFGLSYTEFEFESINLNPDRTESLNILNVDVTVKNSGSRAGQETVQIYVGDTHSDVLRPVKELKGFEKIYLEPGEKKTVRFSLERSAFSYWDEVLEAWTMEPGEFVIYAGSSSRSALREVIRIE
ncbi:MAG: glycoside hydrolase family 3 C-terminal domain-containing protein, partial [Spirochaetales bacterium]|nr:glycoside hydrolase family 3 C-terminal domain-containing protein [Spirochaetales bacterium]